MAQFAFTSSQGRFDIPDGESRIGSDSACPVCIQGEGVLPVHAYLKVENGKLLVRPASDKSPLLIDGQPVKGPQHVQPGQTLTLGALKLEVKGNGQKSPSPWKRRWVRITTYTAASVLVLVGVAVLARYLVFNESYVREAIVEQIEKVLEREDAEIGEVQLSLLDGHVVVKNLKVPNKETLSDQKYLLEVDRIDAKVDSWALVRSGGKSIIGAKFTVKGPRVAIERIERNGRAVSNIDDILEKFGKREPSDEPLQFEALDAVLELEGGRVEFNDTFTEIGKSVVEDLSLRIAQKGLANPLDFQLTAKTVTRSVKNGKVVLGIPKKDDGTPATPILLFDEFGTLREKPFDSAQLQLKLEKFDLARICRHLQLELPVYVYGKQLKVVPAKPITGELTLWTRPDGSVNLDSSGLTSESILSVLEGDDRPPLGNIPTRVVASLVYDSQQDAVRKVEFKMFSANKVGELSNEGEDHPLYIKADGQRTGSGDALTFYLSAKLEELCATDVGERLDLKGRLLGRLSVNASVRHSAGETKIDWKASLSDDAMVMVPNPRDEKEEGKWQPVRFQAGLFATAENDEGAIKQVKVDEFYARADSFEVKSMPPHMIVKSLDDMKNLALNADFRLKLMGREFSNEFRPILGLLGFDRAIEEVVDVVIQLYTGRSKDGKNRQQISLGVRGQAMRQWKAGENPQELSALIDYFPQAYVDGLNKPNGPAADGDDPYMILRLAFGNETKRPYMGVWDMALTRRGRTETVRIPNFTIDSDLVTLRERYLPYLERIEELAGVKLLDHFRVGGDLESNGNLNLYLDPGARDAKGSMDVAFDLSLKGNRLSVEYYEKDGDEPRRWSEPKPQLVLKGRYRDRPAPNAEEAGLRRLDLDRLSVDARVGKFDLAAKNFDLWLTEKLQAGKLIQGKVWSDVADEFQFNGAVTADAVAFLHEFSFLADDSALAGTLQTDIHYSRKKDAVSIGKLEYTAADESKLLPPLKPFWLKQLNASAELAHIRDLFPARGAAPKLPIHFLGKHLVVKALEFDTPAFIAWLKKHEARLVAQRMARDAAAGEEPVQGGGPKKPDAPAVPFSLTQVITRGVYEPLLGGQLTPHGPWSVKDLVLRPGEKENAWQLVGKFRHDVTATLPKGEGALPSLVSIKGPWRIDEKRPAGLGLGEENKVLTLHLEADLGEAGLELANLLPGKPYRKAAGQPLLVKIVEGGRVELTPRKCEYQFGGFSVAGGPLEIDVANATLNTALAKNEKGEDVESLISAQAERVALKGGASLFGHDLPVTLTKASYKLNENGKDAQVAATLGMDKLDLGVARALAGADLVPGAQLKGAVQTLEATYAGSMNRLVAGAPDYAKRDRLAVKGLLKGVRLDFSKGPGRELVMQADGPLDVSLAALKSSSLKVTLSHDYTPSGGAPRRGYHAFTSAGLSVTPAPAFAQKGLLVAVQGDGMPLVVRAPLAFAEGAYLDLEGLLAGIDQLGTALGQAFGGAQPAPGSGNPFDAIVALDLETSVTGATELRYAGYTLTGPEVPAFTLRKPENEQSLHAVLPKASGFLYGGPLKLTDAAYVLTSPDRIAHKQTLDLRDADLGALAQASGGAGGYELKGKTGMAGSLKGDGLEKPQRRTWNGNLQLTLSDFVAAKPGAKPKKKTSGGGWTDIISKGIPGGLTKGLGGVFGDLGGVGNMFGLGDSLPGAEMLKKFDIGNMSLNSMGGAFGLGMQVLGGSYGIDTEYLEFEATTINITITNGIAEIPRGTLKGKGNNAGLELAFRAKADLAAEKIESMEIWPTKLPEETLKILSVDYWPANVKKDFLADLADGGLAVKASGPFSNPSYTFPKAKMQSYVMRAMMNTSSVNDENSLVKGTEHFNNTWGLLPDGVDRGATALDFVGIALPGTEAESQVGSSGLGKVANSSTQWGNLFSRGEKISSRESLRRIARRQRSPAGTDTTPTPRETPRERTPRERDPAPKTQPDERPTQRDPKDTAQKDPAPKNPAPRTEREREPEPAPEPEPPKPSVHEEAFKVIDDMRKEATD